MGNEDQRGSNYPASPGKSAQQQGHRGRQTNAPEREAPTGRRVASYKDLRASGERAGVAVELVGGDIIVLSCRGIGDGGRGGEGRGGRVPSK